MRGYFAGETQELPDFYSDQVRRDLGPLFSWLPQGSVYHDHYAYLKSEESSRPRAQHLPVAENVPAALDVS